MAYEGRGESPVYPNGHYDLKLWKLKELQEKRIYIYLPLMYIVLGQELISECLWL